MTSVVPSYDHIVVVVEENHSLANVIGNPQASYINFLANSGVLLTNYHAITHPSEPNYFALYAGSTFGVADDGDRTESGPTLASILQAGGRTFVGYVDDGSPRKHNPWESFPEGFSVESNFTTFPSSNFSLLPNVSFVIPNLNHDMHDGTIAQADQWLQGNLGGYAQWAVTHNSLLVVTWDEDDFLGTNQVPTILYGANLNAGQYAASYNHYDLLNTLLAANHLAAPNNAFNAAGIASDVFSQSPVIPVNGGGNQHPSLDFTLDARTDILWRHDSGAIALWTMNGAQKAADQVVSGMGNDWKLADTADFDADGRPDVLWRNDNGQVRLWTMNGAQKVADQLVSNMGNDWHLQDAKDFNGDGKADVLWRHDNGAVAVWTMNGAQKAADQVVSGMGNDWHFAAAEDFNGDGKTDILWRHDNGTLAVWTMNGTQKAADQVVFAMDNSWKIADTADFNGDGKTDILWRNDSGALVVWTMNGGQKAADQFVSNLGNDWHLVDTADFNGDGKADILFRHDSGAVAIWTMNGGQKAADQVVSQLGNDWHFIGVGDFNADHKADILWRHDTGAVALWTMSGAQKIADQVVSQMGHDWMLA